MWKRIGSLLAALLLITTCMTTIAPVGLAATDAVIEAKQTDNTVTIAGQTAEDDPDRVALIVFDEGGQAIYFQDVTGGGSSFQIDFEPPETATTGDATAVLYSSMTVSTVFKLKANAEPIEEKIKVSFSITGYQGDEIVEKKSWSVKRGATVFSLLEYVAEETELEYEVVDDDGDGHDVYIKSIDGLAEFDKGPASGWVYRVNGEGPQAPVDRYKLKSGDNVELLYTSDLGGTEIGGTPGVSASRLAQSDLLTVDKAFGRLVFADTNEKIEIVIRSLLFDLANESIEEQQKYVSDVGRFLQAAYERAATVAVTSDERATVTEDVEIRQKDVKELLAQQKEMRGIMDEILESSTLYKPFLNQLQPAFAVALPDRGDNDSYRVTIVADAWKLLNQENVQVGITRGDWRVDLFSNPAPGAAAISDTSTFIRFYDDQAQTSMVETILNSTNAGLHPLTSAYRIVNEPAGALRHRIHMPLTGVKEAGEWPAVYVKENEQANWQATASYVTLDEHLGKALSNRSGDFMVLAAQSSFQDVLNAPAQLAWAKEPVNALAAVGVVQGETPLQFGLQAVVSKPEFTHMLARLLGQTATLEAGSDKSAISRMEVAQLLAKASGEKAQNPVIKGTDLQGISPEALDAIALSTEKGWLRGKTNERFDPHASITKAEAAVVLYRFWLDQQK